MYNFVNLSTHVCEYECVQVRVRAASRKTDERNCSVGSVV